MTGGSHLFLYRFGLAGAGFEGRKIRTLGKNHQPVARRRGVYILKKIGPKKHSSKFHSELTCPSQLGGGKATWGEKMESSRLRTKPFRGTHDVSGFSTLPFVRA